jgi:uncharacterized protein YrzB (UPF0473 family)
MKKIILEENGKDVEYDVLFTFKDEKNNKEYIIYTDDSEYLYAAYFDNGEINYIDNPTDQAFIEKVIDIVKKSVEE